MRRRVLFVLPLICIVLLGCGSLFAQVAISNGASLSNGAALIPGNPCVILTNSLPPGTSGVLYDQPILTASCLQPFLYSVFTGTFPPWATFNPATGEISGIAAPGEYQFVIKLQDGSGGAFFTQALTISTGSSGGGGGSGDPLPPDAALSAWDFSQAGTPTGTTVLCVGTPINAALLPGGGCASSFAGSTAGFQAALNAVACGQIVNVAALSAGVTIQYGPQTLPNNVICTPSTYVWVTGDLSDTAIPADGVRPDPSYIGIPNTALSMSMYPYPGINPTPGVGARHLPQIIVPATSNGHCFSFNPPNVGANTPSIAYWRISQRLECTRDQSGDALTSLIDLGYQPNAPGQDCEISNGLPVHADRCAADQPHHIVISQNVIHGDAQRQTVRGLAMGGSSWVAFVNNYGYDIQDSFAGGQGDAQFIAGGFGHGYTGSGNWIFDNNFTASSSEGMITCGAFSEPLSPITGKDGTPASVIVNHHWFYKPITWDTQRGQASNEPLANEGVVYPPIGDQEIVWSPTTFQVQQGHTFTPNNTWLNDSAGGWNRFGDTPAGAGTVTVDGTDYKTVNSANGIITRAFLTVGSAPWAITNVIQWTYTACSGAGVPIAACTAATTPGTHTLIFNGLVIDGRFASLGNDRHLSTTITATVTTGAPVNQISLSPSAPDLQIQPSYTDSFNNNRNFAYVFQAVTNFTSVSLAWKVDGVVNGNATVGRICSVTAVPCVGPASNDSRVVYVSGTGLGAHTISVTSAGGTTTSQPITISKTSPVWAYDLKAMTVKNMWEAKCMNREIVHYSLFENTWGSNGNGGGQNTALLCQPANNGNQVKDGNGVTVGYGPMSDSDILFDHNHLLHMGGGLIVAGLSTAKGIHRITFQHLLLEDFNCSRWSHGFKFANPLFCGFTQFSGATGKSYGPLSTPGILPWTSPTNPLTNDINYLHITEVGGTTAAPGIYTWLSIANQNLDTSVTPNTGNYQLGPFAVKDGIFVLPGKIPFFNNQSELNDCGTNITSGKPETTAFQGAAYTPPTPCFSSYSLAGNLLLDNSTLASKFTTPTIWNNNGGVPISSADPTVFIKSGDNGDYRVPFGSQYDAGGARAASDGTALGADIDSIIQSDAIIRWGGPSPMTISTASLPNATHGVAYSQTLTVSGGTGPYTWSAPAGVVPPGAEDILDYAMMPLPDRNNFCLNGASNPKCFKLDGTLMWWMKSFTGAPWDLEAVGPDYVKQLATENVWLNASSYKMYVNAVSLWARYHIPGTVDKVYTPGPNKYSITTNCGADNQPLIDNLGVRGELTGPFTDVPWQTQCIAAGGSVGTCNIPNNTPYLLAKKWIKCTADDITQCTNEEDYWLIKGYGQGQWCPKTWNGSTYVTGTCTSTMQKVAQAAVTPNFACTVPRIAVSDGLPNGTQVTSQPPFTIVDSTGELKGKSSILGTTKFTVQVEDSAGHIAQKTLSLTVQ